MIVRAPSAFWEGPARPNPSFAAVIGEKLIEGAGFGIGGQLAAHAYAAATGFGAKKKNPRGTPAADELVAFIENDPLLRGFKERIHAALYADESSFGSMAKVNKRFLRLATEAAKKYQRDWTGSQKGWAQTFPKAARDEVARVFAGAALNRIDHWNNPRPRAAPGRVHLWRYNRRSGLWDHQRSIEEAGTAGLWLQRFQDDEPEAVFRVAKHKPKRKPNPRLTAAQRRALPRSIFGLPASRRYPMPDRSHAANAKARATQQYRKGNLTKTQRDHIMRQANLILYGVSSTARGKPRGAKAKRMRAAANPRLLIINPSCEADLIAFVEDFEGRRLTAKERKQLRAGAREFEAFHGRPPTPDDLVQVKAIKGAGRFLVGIGEATNTDYVVPSDWDSHRKGNWTHEGGDHGRKRKTRPPHWAAIPGSKAPPILVEPPGAETYFKPTHGMMG